MDFTDSQLDDIQERIGQQLETLAQHVDQWLLARAELDASDSDQKFQAANQLLDQIEQVAKDKKKSLVPRGNGSRKARLSTSTQRRLDDFKSERSRKTAQALALRGEDGEDLKEMQKWQDEINSWDLLRILSTLQYSRANPEYKSSHAQRYNKLHKYSADTHLWTKFLIMDDSAREKKLVLEWLERCSRDDQADIDTVLTHFDESMGNGETGWSHGWLNTREAIKGHKRFNQLKGATPVKSVTGKGVSFSIKDSSESRVTQLDPDAPTRQGRKLEKEDEKHEHNFWVVCYDMFRRGMSWEKILGWCEERNEGWRAASLGAAQDLPRNESRLCLAGPYAGALWRRMCYKAAQEISADRYERATYGLLAGDVASVEPVCQSWTDWLYVNYNSLLLNSFEEWLKKHHPERFPSIVSQKYALYDSVPKQADDMDIDGMNTTLRILGNDKFSDKAREAVYLFQGSFVAHAFDRFAANLGIAIAQVFGASETSLLKMPPPDAPEIPFYQQCAQDIDTIRLAVHAFIIYRDLSFEMRPTLIDHADNIILCYINYLRELRKYEAIPTYAKCLSNEQVVAQAMGRLLFDITETSEQNQMVSLIDGANLDLVSILTEQYVFALAELGLAPGGSSDEDVIDIFPLVEPAADAWAGWRVAKQFDNAGIRRMIEDHKHLFSKLKPEEQRLVRSMQWFFHVRCPWGVAFGALAMVMRQLFKTGRFFAALCVTRFIPVGQMSEHLTPLYLDHSINVFHIGSGAEVDLDESDELNGYEPIGAKPEPEVGSDEFTYQAQVEYLKSQALAAKELQDLCLAINELILWRLVEDIATKEAHNKGMIDVTKENLHELHKVMRPLLHNFMEPSVSNSNTSEDPEDPDSVAAPIVSEQDAADIHAIKLAYLPPILLAYTGALTFASTILGPETLLKPLELANLLADDTLNAGLTDVMVEADRLSDLVETLALSQRRLIRMQQDAATAEKRERVLEQRLGGGKTGRLGVVKKGQLRKKRSALGGVKKREWRGETLDLWDVSKQGI